MPVDVSNFPSLPNDSSLPVKVCRLAAVDVWIFDLDNTLYSASSNLFPAIERRMGEFIARSLGVTPEEARRCQKRFFREHGTTLRGLMLEHAVDPLAFLDYVHAIDLSVITPSPALDRALDRLPGRKLVFTNASRRHAEGVMARLGIARHFEAIQDIIAADFLPKPDPRPYTRLLRCYDVDPVRACMVEDMAGNLIPAAALGMTTVWLRTDSAWGQPAAGDLSHIHHVIDDLPAWLAALGTGAGGSPSRRMVG
jgi:putative hydrolase of the HAD superfamily